MNTLRRFTQYPLALVYVALVVSRSKPWLRRFLDVTKYAAVVMALAFLCVYVASYVGVVPY